MPAVKGCSSPVVPAKHVWDDLDDLPSAIGDWPSFTDSAAGAVGIGWPYFFGLLMVIISVRGWRFRRSREKYLGVSVAVLVGCLAVLLVVFFVWELVVPGFPVRDPWFIFFAVLAVVSPLYFLRSVRRGPAGLLCLRWYVAVCGLAWFGMWFASGGVINTYYGLWLSIMAMILILVSTHAEARIRTRRNRKRTFWNLLRCRLELYDLDGPRCFGCGYLLVGLPSHRCPECGLEFDPLEYGLPSEAEAIASAQNSTPGQRPGVEWDSGD